MERLAISRDHPGSSVPQQSRHPSQPQHPQPQQVSRELSRTTSDHHHEGQAGSSQSQSAAQGQLGGTLKASHEEGWYLKSIDFTSPSGVTRQYNIITQNYNGCAFPPYLQRIAHADIQGDKRPCSFIAICNILILREQIEILPPDRRSVSYEFLAQLVGEHILLTAPGVDVSAALSMMPLTTSKSHSPMPRRSVVI